MSDLFTNSLECAGECGAKISITLRLAKSHVGDLMGVAELLGWSTSDRKVKGKKEPETDVFCPFCQARARRIVNGK
jgi:hypothetical protein